MYTSPFGVQHTEISKGLKKKAKKKIQSIGFKLEDSGQKAGNKWDDKWHKKHPKASGEESKQFLRDREKRIPGRGNNRYQAGWKLGNVGLYDKD